MATSTITPLPDSLLEPLVTAALAEDMGDAGDITTRATIKAGAMSKVRMVSRQQGCLAGADLARLAFHALDPQLTFTSHMTDGERVAPGDVMAEVSGASRAILSAERVALNFMGHLSGIASATADIVDAIADTNTKVCCTRKTTPGLRAIEKYAVRCGGGVNHRFGLYDAILIKDNHIAIAGGIGPAIESALAYASHMAKIEVEVDTLDQLEEALAYPIDAVLLDNMSPDMLKDAVTIIDGRVISEASGRVTRETAQAIAASGVDLISVGWLTHSAPCLDIGLDWVS